MSNNQETFISKAKLEIKQRIKNETKSLEQLKIEEEELINAQKGYSDFYDELEKFITESCKDFKQTEEELPFYFRSNINEVYQNYSQIRKDAVDEIRILKAYINKNKKELASTQRTLKFYQSQYMDSDFYEVCLPLVEIIDEKIVLYEKNEETTLEIIIKLEEIYKKLENWR